MQVDLVVERQRKDRNRLSYTGALKTFFGVRMSSDKDRTDAFHGAGKVRMSVP